MNAEITGEIAHIDGGRSPDTSLPARAAAREVAEWRVASMVQQDQDQREQPGAQ